MKRLIGSLVLCIAGFSTSAVAEKIQCVDKQHVQHIVEFVGNNLDVVYVDKLQYDYVGETKDGKVVKFADEHHVMTFLVDPTNRDWFFLRQTTKGKNSVEKFYALCDNVNVIEDEQQPKLVLNK